ncbi:acyl-CoA reductase [Cellulophaga baltica]|uniref:acyl-CoA reductase n=1 Tax=Cellulophaga TaxID=104264 RepID=UPI001C06F181|nr:MULTISPECIES: acyl-CoA reductase [Cellulophaga]MBU2996169.1 acyl-CoA reductase [Cellulophaga baltica]MDO6767564.1 acyl-CoA reductase [Cellulophaga sp. 1_MG-2023]
MTDLTTRKEAFVKLGTFFKEYCVYANNDGKTPETSSDLFTAFDDKIALAKHKNGWFNRENILFSIKSWSKELKKGNLESWLANYKLTNLIESKTVALIMAGNIPLVGFHDFLSVLITGHKAIVKLSSNDNILLPFVAKVLIDIEPTLKDAIAFEDNRLSDFDLVIATGSNNTARYFEHYFKNKPHIIRKNRNSVAVLTGNETEEELTALGEDIFQYYGLGCRSVSKLLVPQDYDFDAFFKAIFKFSPIVEQIKYANNYDYNKAVYLMSEFKLLDNGFLILKEDESYASPIASLFYEKYDSIDSVKNKLDNDKNKIQCVVSKGVFDYEVKFGKTQKPNISDYADNVDTISFLLTNS